MSCANRFGCIQRADLSRRDPAQRTKRSSGLGFSWALGVALGIVGEAGCTIPTDAEWLPPNDRAPFAVVASSLPVDPASPDARQPLNPTIQIRFSDFPDPVTVTFPTLRLGPRGQSIQYTYDLSLVDKQLTLRPRGHLLPETDYLVDIDSGLRSLAGQPLAPAFELRFHTGSDVLPAPPPPAPVTLATLVADGSPLRKSCAFAGCHSSTTSEPVRGFDFAAAPAILRQQLVGAPRAGIDRLLIVEAGRPETSYLLRKLLARTSGGYLRIEGEPMPPPGSSPAPIALDTLRAIESWIRDGAN